MKKQKALTYAAFLFAEVLALLYDSISYILYPKANSSEIDWVVYELAPLFIIGALVMIGLSLGRNIKLGKFFIGLIVFNFVVMGINTFLPLYTPLILFNYRGMALILGVSVGGIISALLNKEKKS